MARRLGESPETAIALHVLRTGEGRAFASGEAAVVIWDRLPAEPQGFGDPASVVEILLGLTGWKSVEVAVESAEEVGRAIREALGCGTRQGRDLYGLLDGPPSEVERQDVRLLKPGDEALLSRSGADLGITDPRAELALIAAGAVIDDRVVAMAHSAASSERYADIGVWTLPAWQGRGLATAAARLVVREVQHQGKTPVWTTGDYNVASQRVATKLGFRRCGERVYVIPDVPSNRQGA